jgi:hypothetical protein
VKRPDPSAIVLGLFCLLLFAVVIYFTVRYGMGCGGERAC